MVCTPEQVRELMRQSHFHSVSEAAQKAGMSVGTAKKYIKAGGRITKPPSRMRTDQGVFTAVWPLIEWKLGIKPNMQVSRLLDWLIVEYPGKFHHGQLRTLQRHVRDWLCLYGPDKEVFFLQTDGTVI